jgi:MoxR-like ATPase
LRESIGRSVVGRHRELDALMVAFFAGGHVILEGPPGTAKTLLVRALATASGCAFRRVQFTPDLMPADITGTSVHDAAHNAFRFVRGPIFSDVVLADEVNRAPAKTQAAMLEAMEERQVTADGQTYALPPAFAVFATMNPIEFEGTYPLPEAQLDRFLFKIPVGELDEASERIVLERHASGVAAWDLAGSGVDAVLDPASVVNAREHVGRVMVEPAVQGYVLELIRRSRRHPSVTWGASTRAAVGLLRASRARAACDDRSFVIPDDVKFCAPFALAHRMVLEPEAQMSGVTALEVVGSLLDDVPVPRAAAAVG